MDIFDNLKDRIEKMQKFFGPFVENASFPPGKKESGLFTTREAAILMDEFINLLVKATKNKDKFIRRIAATDMDSILISFDYIEAAAVNKNFDGFVAHVENLIPKIHTLEMVFMGIADNNRYQQITDLEHTLI